MRWNIQLSTEVFNLLFEQKKYLNKQKNKGTHSYAITARGPLVQPATEKRIKDYYPNIFEEIIFCNYHDTTKPQFTKEEMCQKY